SMVSEARLASLLDTAAVGMLVVDDTARILLFNCACEFLFGYAPAEVIGRDLRMVISFDYPQDRYANDSTYRYTGLRQFPDNGSQVKGGQKDAPLIPLEIAMGEAGTPDGQQYLAVLRDLRPRRDAEQRLSQLQGDLLRLARLSAMDQMGAALAHELNQP